MILISGKDNGMKKILQPMLMISICTVANAAPANPTSNSSRDMAYSTVDTHLGEALYPDEEAMTVNCRPH